jgi:hypothetical protein
MILKPVLTNVGLNEVARIIAAGQKLSIEKVWLGSGLVNGPLFEYERLSKFEEEYPVSDSVFVDSNRIHLTSVADNPGTEYPIREIGYVTNTGILLAVSGSDEILAHKVATTELILAFDLLIESIPGDVMEVTGPGTRLNLNMAPELLKMTQSILDVQLKLDEALEKIRLLEGRV